MVLTNARFVRLIIGDDADHATRLYSYAVLPHHPFIRKTKVIAVADNDMIENLDAQKFACGGQFLRKLFIFRAGRYVGAGVIVNTNDRGGEFLQGGMDDFPHNRHGLIDGSCGGVADINDAIVAVEIDNFKYFRLEIAHLRHDDIDDILGGSDLLLDGANFVFPETPPDFEGGLNLRDFGRAQAFEFFPLAHVGVAHIAEGAELINNPARQINGAHARTPVRKRIARSSELLERSCAALEQLFPGPVVRGQLLIPDDLFFSVMSCYPFQ